MQHVYDSSAEAQLGAANRIADLIATSEDFFSLGLAGGSTPRSTYELLRGRSTGWNKVHAWLGDERWVAHQDERSNGRMAMESLLSHVDATFHRPRYSDSLQPEDAAAFYEAELRAVHRDRRPDVVLLGLGEDGHTASLFPGSRALEEMDRWYVSNVIPDRGEDRLTATYPLLWTAKKVLVLAVGEGKAAALAETMAGQTPTSKITHGDAEVEWHIDRAAAALL